MRLPLLAAALLTFLTGTFPALAQDDERSWEEIEETFARGCGDDQGVDRCDSDVQRRMHGLYGIESLSDLLERGLTARRALFVDGYGNDVAAITFARIPGRSPTVEVRSPRLEGAPQPSPLTAAVSSEAWGTVLSRSENFDQLLARELAKEGPDSGNAPISLCLHAWFVVVEAVDAPRVSPNVLAGTGSAGMDRDSALAVEAPMNPGSIRSDAESACADGLAVDYAFELADLALAALPECSTLSPDDFRTVAALLGQCHRLGGDRLVAGEAARTVAKLERALRMDQAQELEWLFVGIGDERAARFKEAISGGSLFFRAPVGIDADHAKINGQIGYFNVDGQSQEVADITIRLLRQTGDFVIDTFAVSNRRPFTPEP